MSALLILSLMCGFLANLPAAFSRPPWLPEESGSGIEADESAKRQSAGCGSFNYANNTLKSPGYPSYYPNYMDCEYWVPIPSGMAMRIDFVAFDVESHSSCNYDYLKITNGQNQTFGQFCGVKNGFHVIVTGDYVVLKFHSDGSVTRPGYLLSFNAFSNGTQSPPTALPTAPPTPDPCGYVQNNTLVSPGYPGYYPYNMDCSYWVYIPYGKDLQIYFDFFEMDDCGYDYLKISNELNQTFGSYCGYKTGQTVTVTGWYAVLTFHSDSSVYDDGYKLYFSYVSQGTQSPPTTMPTAPPTADPCGYVQNNTLVSPGYPGYYPNNMDCTYWVYIPYIYGKDLQIYFDFFEVNDCGYDYLKISNDQNQTFGSYCGYKTGQTVTVTGRYAVLTFHSDSSVYDDGYKLVFSYVSQGTQFPPTTMPTAPPTADPCGYVQNNTLVSPGYPSYYPNNMDCSYWVYIPYGKDLQIYFDFFEVNDCGWDYLKISNEQNQTFGSYCGYKTGQTVTVTGQYAVLTFHSDSSYTDDGYKLFFSYVSQVSVNFTTSAPWPPYTTYPPYTTPSRPYPSFYPSGGPKCKLQTYIRILEIVLNEMNNVVEYELGSKYSVREYKARVKRALSNVQAAKKRAGGQKRDVREVRKVDELENRAAELLKRLDTKEAQSKMRDLLNRKMAETRAENAPIDAY